MKMRLLVAAVAIAGVACGNLVAPKSGYGVPNAGDPGDSGINHGSPELACRSGYNIATGRDSACNDGFGFPASGFHAPSGDYKHLKRSAIECFSGYIIAFGDTTCA